MRPDHFAKEARRLRNDETLILAINAAQTEAMKELVTVDADDKTAILRLQARVQAFDEILSVLERAILSQAQQPEVAVP